MWRRQNPCAQWAGMGIGTATMENGMQVPQKIKKQKELSYDLGMPPLDIYS